MTSDNGQPRLCPISAVSTDHLIVLLFKFWPWAFTIDLYEKSADNRLAATALWLDSVFKIMNYNESEVWGMGAA